MNAEALHLLALRIREKLQDGRLPRDSSLRARGSPGDGAICDACGAIITQRTRYYGPSSITFSPWRLRRRTPCQVFVRIGQGLLGVVPRAAHFIEPLGRLNLELVELPLRIRSGRTHVT